MADEIEPKPTEPLRYWCWLCKPSRMFLTAEAKAKHVRTVHRGQPEKTRDPDLDARYDWERRMYRPGPLPRNKVSRRIRKFLGLDDD